VAKATYSLVIEDIWNSVALEERIELISKSQASGIISATISIFVISSVGYGLDNIWFLVVALASGFFVFPLFSSQTWRNGKPSMILAYLAVRTVARRYAHGLNLPDIDIILIYKGQFEEIFSNREDEEMHYQSQSISFDTNENSSKQKEVWIVLLRSGFLLLSEKRGGARLEFVTPILSDTSIDYDQSSKNPTYTIMGSGMNKGRTVRLSSKYQAAHYVFLKRFQAIAFEAAKSQDTLEKLRSASTI
jgi:hypothetical protein